MGHLNFGVIGNCKSAALVSDDGSIDWCCLPEFNSPSVFARILDPDIGGSFKIETTTDYLIAQEYIKGTNLLLTRFGNGKDCFEVIDFMPRYKTAEGGHYTPPEIIRYVRHISGKPKFRVIYDPKLEYSLYETVSRLEADYIKSFIRKGPYNSLYLYTSVDRSKVLNQEIIELIDDEFFLLSYHQKILKQTVGRAFLQMERTKVYWLNWSERTRNFKMYNEQISRSALILKLLSFDKTGAVLAAITTSIPEAIGEVRNWDYRFCWLRDASMVIRIMVDLDHHIVAKRFMQFLINVIPSKDEKIQIVYGINGNHKLTERSLDHLRGFENSLPVRVGNAAYKQKQNDIFGVLMDVIYDQFSIFGSSVERSEELWTITRNVVRTVAENWRKPDRGIWEMRTEPRHFTFSKILCWVAVERGIQIARLIGRDDYIQSWIRIRDSIRKNILKHGWNDKVGAFTQSYGSTELDASNLLMEQYGFMDADDPKYISTVIATYRELSREGLMHRYKNKDDFGIPTTSFTICTFWLINALYKIGQKEEAIRLFNQILGYANHLGLFSEGIEIKTKRLLGNFPQAYSHLALIETAITISETAQTDEEKNVTTAS